MSLPRPPACLSATVAALWLAVPGASSAQDAGTTDSADYQVAGLTPVVCTLSLSGAGNDRLLNVRAADRNVYQIDQMLSPDTLSTRAAAFEVTLDGVCNSAHQVRLESVNNGLWQLSETPPARPAGFGTAVPYEVTARWSEREIRLSADAGVRQLRGQVVPIGEPASGEMVLSFEIREGATNLAANAPLVAGAYVDTLTIVLEPQQ